MIAAKGTDLAARVDIWVLACYPVQILTTSFMTACVLLLLHGEHLCQFTKVRQKFIPFRPFLWQEGACYYCS